MTIETAIKPDFQWAGYVSQFHGLCLDNRNDPGLFTGKGANWNLVNQTNRGTPISPHVIRDRFVNFLVGFAGPGIHRIAMHGDIEGEWFVRVDENKHGELIEPHLEAPECTILNRFE
ncbi:MAG: hypothetical protein H6815_00385 [Phycisphaeraceae bacterium]|nr:hypothetical protein [Phycisphaerales bacterium]MCB9858881.1 hypothetical protein [Phycisphaeraceae bacterium]